MGIIRTKAQYEGLLEEIDELLRADHAAGSAEARKLDELAALVEDYEKDHFPFELPTPVEAIEFRMEQLGLERRDLEPLLGGRNRVSEVLSGRRPLTVRMIRALNMNLGIPADLLLQDPQELTSSIEELDWQRFPAKEMLRRRWIEPFSGDSLEAVRRFIGPVLPDAYVPTLLRHSHSIALGAIDRYALLAWTARVLHIAEKQQAGDFRAPTETADFLAEAAAFSGASDGPREVGTFLAQRGIKLVVERHLPRTRLDGAAMLDRAGQPIVALTIRYDRLDSFWFTLLHEVAHVLLHLGDEIALIADDLDLDRSDSIIEAAADAAARNAFIPRQVWRRSEAYKLRTQKAILGLASQLGIHPAIVAGRLRYETRDYQRFGDLLGSREARRCFPEVHWSN